MTLFILCFTEFITNDDIKTCKHVKIINWVCFNVHKNLENRYKKYYYYLNLFVDQKLQMLMKLNNMIYNMKPYTNENY
jgi:GR25 family glycosyltransferase involved in LPS biosynthesis